ncbi:hypothetical protein [Asticcacaulis sp.]|uniref:hypothetical protein n=1 Tax=Asticcacaulis sp. TaxID=1872648 RepID=UPI002C0B432D|nr:hypothetical protein [Asticcacaulis sp.]HTM82184.1 hypothetical protein [Asticcacaulis sp.]
MLVFVLALIAVGVFAAANLLIFFCENLFALWCAALAGKIALASGGGWPGAFVAVALTFAAASAGLRLAILHVRPLGLQLALAVLIVAPTALSAFGLVEAILWPFVPQSLWRLALAALTATIVATGACRRLWSLQPAHDQTRV